MNQMKADSCTIYLSVRYLFLLVAVCERAMIIGSRDSRPRALAEDQRISNQHAKTGQTDQLAASL